MNKQALAHAKQLPRLHARLRTCPQHRQRLVALAAAHGPRARPQQSSASRAFSLFVPTAGHADPLKPFQMIGN